MILILVLTTLIAFSAADDKKQGELIKQISGIITAEANLYGDTLAAHWLKDEMKDPKSVHKLMGQLKTSSQNKVVPILKELVKEALGSGVTHPEQTELFKLVMQMKTSLAIELALTRAKFQAEGKAAHFTALVEGEGSPLTRSIAKKVAEVANRNITNEEKQKLLSRTMGSLNGKIQSLVERALKKDDKNGTKVAGRSGMFLNNYLSQQQQLCSSNILQRLAQQVAMDNCCCCRPSHGVGYMGGAGYLGGTGGYLGGTGSLSNQLSGQSSYSHRTGSSSSSSYGGSSMLGSGYNSLGGAGYRGYGGLGSGYGSSGLGLGGYSGVSNLWSLNGGRRHLGTGGYNTGGIGGIGGIGSIGGIGGIGGGYYSSSNSQSSKMNKQSDSSSHLSYGNSLG